MMASTATEPAGGGPPVIDVGPVVQAFRDGGGRSDAAAAAAASAVGEGSARASTQGKSAAALARAVDAVRAACSEWGFFQCVHHGIPADVAAAFDREQRGFFALPRATKARVKRTATNSRGWFDDELTKQTPDWKECIDVGCPGRSAVDGENQWPDAAAVPGFRPATQAYFDSCHRLSRALVRACAAGLGVRPEHFDAEAEPHTSYLRLNWYPPVAGGQAVQAAPEDHGWAEPDPAADGVLGINKNTDAGCLTVLRLSPDEPASLQVFRRSRARRGRHARRYAREERSGGGGGPSGDGAAGTATSVAGGGGHDDADGDESDDDDDFDELDAGSAADMRGEWVRVVPVPGALTINIGDMMQVWSNGKYVAPVHRVLAHRHRERFSAPFFYNPSYDSFIRPAPSRGPPRYRPLSWGEFRRRRFEGDFGDEAPDVQISDWLIPRGQRQPPATETQRQQRQQRPRAETTHAARL